MLQKLTPQFIDITRQRDACEPRMSEAIHRVLDHGRFVSGPEVAELEEKLATYLGVKHAVGCANGTDALQVLLRSAGIGQGDAVFVPSLTYAATAEAVMLAGATPVFVDVEVATGNMSAASLAAAVDGLDAGSGLTPKAVLAVDLFGIPADHAALSEVASAHGLKLFYDAAQSFGSVGTEAMCGALGDGAATSFYPSKSLGCFGDGGAMFTNDDDLADALRVVRDHGLYGAPKAHRVLGTNSRLDTIQAAILLVKLEVFDEELNLRQAIADRYIAELGDLVGLPTVPEGTDPCWSYYRITTDRRDDLHAFLGEQGVPSVVYYKEATHLQPAFAAAPIGTGGLAGTEELSRTQLCLPVHPYLTEPEVDMIIDNVRRFFAR
ncbi:MAG: DegT/DnrJ/EryC1/StrS family aminotransferase [Paracoccaceae bacterium]|nr:DegT/DnrJ/EryC1/StrS family aminotransferase [Paracoccaceae bacterium]